MYTYIDCSNIVVISLAWYACIFLYCFGRKLYCENDYKVFILRMRGFPPLTAKFHPKWVFNRKHKQSAESETRKTLIWNCLSGLSF